MTEIISDEAHALAKRILREMRREKQDHLPWLARKLEEFHQDSYLKGMMEARYDRRD